MYLSADPVKPTEQWRTFDVVAPDDPAELPKLVFARGELEPETPYYIRVSPSNDKGEGPKSPSVHFVTASGRFHPLI